MIAESQGSGIDATLLKAQAANRWPEILNRVAGLPAESLDGKHHPCPRCGGTDRFRLIDAEAGAVLCSKCCTSCGDGIAAVQWALGVNFKAALQAIGDHLGLAGGRRHVGTDEEFLARVCASKKMPVEAAKAYGAEVTKRGSQRVVRFPMYGPNMLPCSSFDIADDGGKGLSASGLPVGVFLPHHAGRAFIPQPCFLVEGVKDAAASFAIGNEAVGMPTSTLNEKFSHLFDQRDVIAIPDLDQPSFDGFAKTRRRLIGIAKSFTTVRLPGEMGSKHDLRDVLAKPNGRQLVQQAIDARNAGEAESFPQFTLGELTDKFRTLSPPVIHGMIREGETGNFIADPKVGKSWAMYGLAINVATGIEWLGMFPVSQGRVLIIDNELHPETLAHRIPAVGNAMAIPFEDYRDHIDTWCLRGNLRSLQELLIEFRTRVDRGTYKLIIFDAKYRFAAQGTSENDNASETLVYNLLDQIALETRAALFIVHHATKGSQSDKKVTDVGAGAGAQSRAADCHLILRAHEDDGVYVLDGAVRSFPPMQPVPLRWSFPIWVPDEFADAAKLKGKQTRSEERTAERDREGFDKIIAVLLKGPATASVIRQGTGISKDRCDRLLNLLVSDDQIRVEMVKIKGNDCREYHVVDE